MRKCIYLLFYFEIELNKNECIVMLCFYRLFFEYTEYYYDSYSVYFELPVFGRL